MIETFLSRECLQLHEDVTAFQDPQDRQPESDEAECPDKRGKLFRIIRLDHPAKTCLVQRDLLASYIDFDQRIDQSGHDSGADECNQRIHSIDE